MSSHMKVLFLFISVSYFSDIRMVCKNINIQATQQEDRTINGVIIFSIAIPEMTQDQDKDLKLNGMSNLEKWPE